MIVETVTDSQITDLTVTIKGSQTQNVMAMAEHVKRFDQKNAHVYSVKKRDGITLIDKSEIMWLNVSHNTTTIYLADAKRVTVSKPLTRVLEELAMEDLMRVSQSSAVRVKALKAITTGFSGALIAQLKSGENVAISRQFVRRVYQYLKLG